jgi:hypothetical protein
VKLKDEEVASYYAQLKDKVCDPTGCAVAIVDHRPWPNDSNQGQTRAYGSVFKAAAIRWGVYFQRKGKTNQVWIQASGNNIAGFGRRLFEWDEEQLLLRPVKAAEQAAAQADAQLDRRVFQYVCANPGCSQNQVETNVDGQAKRIRESLERLRTGVVRPDDGDEPSEAMRLVPTTGTQSKGKYWKPAPHAGSSSSQADETNRDELSVGPSGGEVRPAPPPPVRGRGTNSPQGSFPLPGDETYPSFLRERFEAGHLTETEHAELTSLHRLVAA